jgi:hypothetical protein
MNAGLNDPSFPWLFAFNGTPLYDSVKALEAWALTLHDKMANPALYFTEY